MLQAIDVSHWQNAGVVEKAVKEAGVKAAIIRLGHGTTLDEKAQGFVEECERFDIPYGFYWYYEGTSSTHWALQTDMFLKRAMDFNPKLPLAIDYEIDAGFTQANQNAILCGDAIENAGYFCTIYSNLNFALTLWDAEVKKRFAFWLADYSQGWGRVDKTGANVVMVQTTNTFMGINLDGDEIKDELLELCKKVRAASIWQSLYLTVDEIEAILHDANSGVISINVSKSGNLYRVEVG